MRVLSILFCFSVYLAYAADINIARQISFLPYPSAQKFAFSALFARCIICMDFGKLLGSTSCICWKIETTNDVARPQRHESRRMACTMTSGYYSNCIHDVFGWQRQHNTGNVISGYSSACHPKTRNSGKAKREAARRPIIIIIIIIVYYANCKAPYQSHTHAKHSRKHTQIKKNRS